MIDKKVWISGERQAKDYLIKNKYKILATNFKNKIGEIDIIAKKDDVFVFVEVKARSSLKFGRPSEAVTTFKQNKIRQVAQSFLIQNKTYPAFMRFDVVEVLDGKLNHIENAF